MRRVFLLFSILLNFFSHSILSMETAFGINSWWEKENFQFFWACQKDDLPLAKELIEQKKVDLNSLSFTGKTGLEQCVISCSNRLFKFLLEKDAPGKEGALFYAANAGNLAYCKALIAHKVNVNAVARCNQTALVAAVKNGNFDICRLLIEHDAQINSDALSPAVACRNMDILELLLDQGLIHFNSSNVFKTVYMRDRRAQLIITKSNFTQLPSKPEFMAVRNILMSILCAFRRICPSLPKDLRKKILFDYDSSLKKVVWNMGALGTLSKLDAHDITQVPLPTLRALIQNNQIDPEQVVTILKKHHVSSLKLLAQEADFEFEGKPLHLILEQRFGLDIEKNIRQKLRVFTLKQALTYGIKKSPVMIHEVATSLIAPLLACMLYFGLRTMLEMAAKFT